MNRAAQSERFALESPLRTFCLERTEHSAVGSERDRRRANATGGEERPETGDWRPAPSDRLPATGDRLTATGSLHLLFAP